MTPRCNDGQRLTTVAIADAHPIILGGVQALLERESPFRVIHHCTSGGDLLQAVDRCAPDIVIADFSMGVRRDLPSADGFVLLRKLLNADSRMAVVLYTGRTSAAEFQRMEKVGVHAIVSKKDHVHELLSACSEVLAGRTFRSSTVRAILRADDAVAPVDHDVLPLTSKELDVIRLFATGMSIREIAEYLGRAASTISVQKHMAMRKIGVLTNSELFRYARAKGLA